jgi:predicted TIM-barrel fold metal-dependent hydrolase
MEEAGIDKTIISPVKNHTYEKANEAIAEMCGSHSGKLIGFAKHDPESEAGRVPTMLRREVEKLGLKGLKLHKLPTRDMLEAAGEFGIPVLYHPKEVSDF